MNQHPDLISTFKKDPNIHNIWKSYAACRVNAIYLPIKCKKQMNQYVALTTNIRDKPEKSLKTLMMCFTVSNAYVDFINNGLLVAQGVIFDYLDYCFDVIVISNNRYFTKLNNRYYHRNSNLKVYITSEFIAKHKKPFDIIYPFIKHISIEIVSRQQLKSMVNEE